MKRTVYASEKVAHINFAEELKVQSVDTICERYGLKCELDDMYNLNFYAEDEMPVEVSEMYEVATLED